MTRTLNSRGDWVGLIEAIHEPSPSLSDEEWAERIATRARSLSPRAAHAMSYGADRDFLGVRFMRPETSWVVSTFAEVMSAAREVWAPFHLGPAVLALSDGVRRSAPEVGGEIMRRSHGVGLREVVAIVAHPAPGVVAARSMRCRTP